MVDNLGVDTYHGAGLEVTFDTAVAATQMLPVISNGLNQATVNNPATTLTGGSSRGRSRRGANVVTGPVVIQWTYDDRQVWLEQFFGGYTSEASPVLDHYDFETRFDQSLTIAENKRDSVVHEYSGVRFGTATLVGNPTDGWRWTMDAMGSQRAITGTTNTAGGLQGLTAPGAEILYEDMTFRIGDLNDALAVADDVCPESLTLTLGRNAIQHIVNKRVPLPGQVNGFFDPVLSFTLPRIDTDQYITWKEAGTLVQVEIDLVAGAEQKTIRLPVGRITQAPQTTDGPELQTMDIEVMFEHNKDAANTQTGFTFTEAIRLFEEDGA